MSDVLFQLAQLATAAEMHADERHQIVLQQGDWEQVDRILNRERQQGNAADQESIALCYGAWIGESLVRSGRANWTGLHEPVPPRLRIGTVCYSPIDAVRRRLISPDAGAVALLVKQACFGCLSDHSQAVEENRASWDARSSDPAWASGDFVLPTSREEIQRTLDPWLVGIDLEQREVLCLAAAGGTHGPLYAAAGARVTVVDFSGPLLAIDEEIARRFQLELRTRTGDLRDLSFLPDRHFDIVIQPVSTCYIPEVFPMYRETFRTLKPGGVYLSQHKSPGSLQSEAWQDALSAYVVAFPAGNGTPLPPADASRTSQREPGMREFVHSLEDLVGDLCRAGFVLEGMSEPVRGDAWSPPGTAAHRAVYFPPYLKLLARRP